MNQQFDDECDSCFQEVEEKQPFLNVLKKKIYFAEYGA